MSNEYFVNKSAHEYQQVQVIW